VPRRDSGPRRREEEAGGTFPDRSAKVRVDKPGWRGSGLRFATTSIVNRSSCLTAVFLAVAVSASAAPYVPAYERFHSDEPAAESGALLYSELGCANCHGSGGPIGQSGTGSSRHRHPSQRRMDPRLSRGSPTRQTGDEHAVDVLRTGRSRIEPVLHYLLSVPVPGKTTKKADLGKHANAERGSDLYHTIGCVACHAPSPDFQPPGGSSKAEEFSYASVSFSDLSAEYSLESLRSLS